MKNKQLTKSLLAIIMLLVLIGCNKEKNTITEYIGTVIEGTTMAPLPDVKVSVANGSRVLVSTVTDEEGAFSMYVNFDKVTERDSLIIDGNPGLPYVKKFELKGMGKEQYDYRTLVLYNKSNTEVKTSEVTSIKANSAVCGGTVNEGNDILVTQRGVCWSKQPNPILFNNNNITLDGEGGGQFTSNLTGLEEQTKYYVRAYATNGDTVVYGSQKEFTTTALLPAFQYAGTTYYVHPDVGTMTWQSAIDYCENLTFAGYSDWFLPDKDELNTMYVNRNTIGGFITTGDDCKYWSSTKPGSYPWYQKFDDSGYQNTAPSSNYHRVRPVRKDGGGTSISAPSVITIPSPTVTSNSATCGGNVTSDGGATIIQRGICYSTSQSSVLTGTKVPCSTNGTGNYTCNLTGLSASTRYYYCAYAINSEGTSYGSVEHFDTSSGGGTTPTAPTVVTIPSPSVTSNSATCGGNVTSDGGATIIQRGICYSTSQSSVLTGTKVPCNTNGTGNYTCSLTGLSASTRYYYCAYAINSEGTSHGSVEHFDTSSGAAVPPTVTTKDPTDITPNSATCSGRVTDDGGAIVSQRGICYSTEHNPDISSPLIEYASTGGTGTFYCDLSNLSPNTTYFVRAFAINSAGPGYGLEIAFKTEIDYPTVTTGTYNAANNSVVCYGNVVSDGGSPIIERGICYSGSFSVDPMSGMHVPEGGTSIGSFSCQITNLMPGTQYYYRAYATNSKGTDYGDKYVFTTTGGHVEGWLQYDNGYGTDALGFEEGGTLYWANMFPSSMLSSYEGTSVTKVEAYLNMAGVYTLRLYSGGTSSPGSLIYQHNFNHNNSSAVWATMTLPEAVSLNTSQNLWVVISVTHSAGEFPAGCCQNAGNPNGRWYSDGVEWGDIGDVGDYTWGIHTFVTNGVKGSEPILLPSYNDIIQGKKGHVIPTISKKNSSL